jgi:hypothetical protein
MSAVWIGLAISAASATYGAYQNNKAQKANEAAYGASQADYDKRIAAAQQGLGAMEAQYNKVKSERPDITWEGYVGELITSLNDPNLKKAYANAKQEDFNVLRSLASSATKDNAENFKATLNSVTNGQADNIVNQRNDLVLNDDTKARYTRALELRAPDIGAGTVKYDDKGQLIEGQRADKQVFQTAYEVTTETNRERLANLTALQRDSSSIAENQKEKALSFMPFYDRTGLAVNAFVDSRKERIDFAKMDEAQAFDLYKTFALAASGITPSQPNYQPAGPGNAAIAEGIKGAGSALGAYYTNKQNSAKSSGGTTYN